MSEPCFVGACEPGENSGRPPGGIQSRNDANAEDGVSDQALCEIHVNHVRPGDEKPDECLLHVSRLIKEKLMAENASAHVGHEKPIRGCIDKESKLLDIYVRHKKISVIVKPFLDNEKPFARNENAITGILRGANVSSTPHQSIMQSAVPLLVGRGSVLGITTFAAGAKP